MIGGIISGIGSMVGSAIQGGLNYQSQKDNLAYEKWLNKKKFKREDSAHQREVADLRLAGLSPTLSAGGSGAAVGNPIATSAPQIQGIPESAGAVLGAILQKKQIEKTEAEKQLTRTKNAELGYNLQLAKRSGFSTNNTSNAGKTIKDATTYLDQLGKDWTNAAKKGWKALKNTQWLPDVKYYKHLWKQYQKNNK